MLKAPRKNTHINYRSKVIRITIDFSLETIQDKGMICLKCRKENTISSEFYTQRQYLSKIWIK